MMKNSEKITDRKLTTCLWFKNDAKVAVDFYSKIFKQSKINKTTYYNDASAKASGMKSGDVLTISFELDGMPFVALNGGSEFLFNPSVSFVVNCETQSEIDYYWDALSSDPKFEQCGWLKDQYGISWQIVPKELDSLLFDPINGGKVMNVFLGMKKIEIAILKNANK